jgi:hypothetical protein
MNKRQKKKHGIQIFKDSEVSDLDITLANYILPRLKRFKVLNDMYPPSIGSFEEWNNTIDKMIWSFEQITYGGWSYEYKRDHVLKQRFELGMSLFAMHFVDLWN